jgi:ribosome-binding ATPase YchF (GTP1/OBG family)
MPSKVKGITSALKMKLMEGVRKNIEKYTVKNHSKITENQGNVHE